MMRFQALLFILCFCPHLQRGAVLMTLLACCQTAAYSGSHMCRRNPWTKNTSCISLSMLCCLWSIINGNSCSIINIIFFIRLEKKGSMRVTLYCLELRLTVRMHLLKMVQNEDLYWLRHLESCQSLSYHEWDLVKKIETSSVMVSCLLERKQVLFSCGKLKWHLLANTWFGGFRLLCLPSGKDGDP